ncbi:hypothetical protein [Clostridium sp. Marseille-P299]|uniref:hypothetical protein n=1 Tax=Clostridium sp. Marseille-P299 TaxID=1805477 RepID=UPI00082EF5BD|nr:hypothetical protein [Clostridium sp. Marseille-P299]
MKIKMLFITLLLLISLIGCSKNEEALESNITIKDKSVKIDNKLANKISSEIQKIITESQEGINTIDNFSVAFTKRTTDDNAVLVDVEVSSDYTYIRKAIDSPDIKGMYKAKEKLRSEEDKALVEEYIQGFITEKDSLLNKKETVVDYNIVVRLKDKSNESYELLYKFKSDDGKEQYIPLTEYFAKEDEAAKEQLGMETIDNFLFNEEETKVKIVLEGFSEAYFRGDKESMGSYLSDGVDLNDYNYMMNKTDIYDTTEIKKFTGDLNNIREVNEIEVQYPFIRAGEDSITYLGIELVKKSGEWKVLNFYLEK